MSIYSWLPLSLLWLSVGAASLRLNMYETRPCVKHRACRKEVMAPPKTNWLTGTGPVGCGDTVESEEYPWEEVQFPCDPQARPRLPVSS
ncbi:hypothetical protein EJ06DRAFT_321197 [Trichodelitschia bisporula]|uniref:Uncharacterized protein n=1 Tax=Trichodelitschia bisporula TaxID=703511 RepID=A0A6G1I4A6_9PEZI|nr:hypothetical protein EJ06DRAFT_321197 [Trichodelitschia bisporula]